MTRHATDAMAELPPFWREIWREAEKRIPDDRARQSCFNDGAHFVIGALMEAAKDLVRLRKIDDAHDGPWEDEEAFALFNRQITTAYHVTSERWAEIVGAETVDSMWEIPGEDAAIRCSDCEQWITSPRQIVIINDVAMHKNCPAAERHGKLRP
jgi:hypothetical protein